MSDAVIASPLLTTLQTDIDDPELTLSDTFPGLTCYFDIKKTSVLIYHAGCSDGVLARIVMQRELGDDILYVPAGHGLSESTEQFNEIPSLSRASVVGKYVLLLDICFQERTLLELLKLSAGLFILDHHKSSVDRVSCLHSKHYHISLQNSACVLAWRILHGLKRMPRLLKYVEDNDIGKWALPNSKMFSAGYRGVGSRVLDAAATLERGDMGVDEMINAGIAISSAREQHISRVSKTAALFRAYSFHSVLLRVVNSPDFVDELVENLSGKDIIVCCWYCDHNTNKIKFSLRGKSGHISSRIFAEYYGGGGHDDAAAFCCSLTQHPIFTGNWYRV